MHHDLELVREMVVDVDLNETLGIPHHAEYRMMLVMVVGKGLATDEDQRLVARHRKMEFVEVNQVVQGVFETDDLVWMAGRARLEALEDEIYRLDRCQRGCHRARERPPYCCRPVAL